MSIGGELAEARQRAGLTVADVSGRTRIGEELIRAIEHDEFGACGGDFYARGHIRAIAGAVGADPARLIDIYDALHPAARPALPGQSPRHRAPRAKARHPWLAPVAYVLCLAVIGFAALRLTPATSDSRASARATASAGATGRTAPRSATPSAGASAATQATAPAAPGGSPTASSGRASSPVTPLTLPVKQVTPAAAAAYGPGGTADGDYPQGAALALSGNPATPWHTDWYTTARFGNLQRGTGLLLTLRHSVTAVGVTIRLGATPGADLQVRAGSTQRDMAVVARATDAGGMVRLALAPRPRIRYLLIWFTLLPPDPAGTYQADISRVTVSSAG